MMGNMTVNENRLDFQKLFVTDDGNGVGYGEETWGLRISEDGSTHHHYYFELSQVGDFWPKMSDFIGNGVCEPNPVESKENAIKVIENTIQDRRNELADLEKFLDNFKSATGIFTDKGTYWSFDEDDEDDEDDE